MKIIDQSPLRSEDGSTSLVDRVKGMWQYGLAWDSDRQAEERMLAHLQKGLDNKYTLIRSTMLPGLEVPIPLVLVGPAGIYVIHASAQRGYFRAKDEVWAVMDEKSRRFKPARPNLIRRCTLLSRAVESYLQKEFPNLPEITPLLFLGHPGIHVEAEQPAVRLVRMDAVDRFVGSIAQSPTVLDATEVRRITDALTRPIPEAEKQRESILADETVMTIGNIPMQRRQWLLIGAMGLIEVCLLMIFVVVILAQP
jgi:hypothetical protein